MNTRSVTPDVLLSFAQTDPGIPAFEPCDPRMPRPRLRRRTASADLLPHFATSATIRGRDCFVAALLAV